MLDLEDEFPLLLSLRASVPTCLYVADIFSTNDSFVLRCGV